MNHYARAHYAACAQQINALQLMAFVCDSEGADRARTAVVPFGRGYCPRRTCVLSRQWVRRRPKRRLYNIDTQRTCARWRKYFGFFCWRATQATQARARRMETSQRTLRADCSKKLARLFAEHVCYRARRATVGTGGHRRRRSCRRAKCLSQIPYSARYSMQQNAAQLSLSARSTSVRQTLAFYRLISLIFRVSTRRFLSAQPRRRCGVWCVVRLQQPFRMFALSALETANRHFSYRRQTHLVCLLSDRVYGSSPPRCFTVKRRRLRS